MTNLTILTQDLSKNYGSSYAVDNVSLKVPCGTVYGLLGRNGAGKTTIMKMLLGLVRPSAGSAVVLGMNVERQIVDILQRTAFVSEGKALYASLSPTELVHFARGFYPKWSDKRAELYAQALEIPMKQRFGSLSRGNQTKVCLLLALCQNADLLVFDEPTAGLDPLTVDRLLHILAEDILAEGCTVFFSSHQLAEVEQIADWVGILDHGKLLLEARLDDIKDEFRMVTASGNALPERLSSQVRSVMIDGNFYRYIVARDAVPFSEDLRRNGATVIDVSPLSLREIFLQTISKEEVCTTGNVGATTRSESSSS